MIQWGCFTLIHFIPTGKIRRAGIPGCSQVAQRRLQNLRNQQNVAKNGDSTEKNCDFTQQKWWFNEQNWGWNHNEFNWDLIRLLDWVYHWQPSMRWRKLKIEIWLWHTFCNFSTPVHDSSLTGSGSTSARSVGIRIKMFFIAMVGCW